MSWLERWHIKVLNTIKKLYLFSFRGKKPRTLNKVVNM